MTIGHPTPIDIGKGLPIDIGKALSNIYATPLYMDI